MVENHEVHLVQRPIGMPKKSDFAIVKNTVPALQEGQILIKNRFFSVDPYMRGRMVDRKSYVPPYQLNEVMNGGCVGEIIDSKNKKFSVGETVYGFGGWREYYVSSGKGLTRIDPSLAPIHNFLSILGLTGFTAYLGLIEVGKLKEGDTVFVSAAAGAVGSIACQIAKVKGCKVYGSAGSDSKIKYLLDEVGIDGAFNYKTNPELRKEIRILCPEGIDVYFDNVGGELLDAILLNMKSFGQIVICGMISQYNKPKPDPLYNLIVSISKRLTIRGFIVSDYNDRLMEFIGEMSKWYGSGQIKQKETIIEGIENSIDAFLGLFSGDNIGKMIVKLQN